MENRAHNPKVVEVVADKFIQFFTELPKEINLPPDTFDKLIDDLKTDQASTVDSLAKWLEKQHAHG
jgi:hypothetical protein